MGTIKKGANIKINYRWDVSNSVPQRVWGGDVEKWNGIFVVIELEENFLGVLILENTKGRGA